MRASLHRIHAFLTGKLPERDLSREEREHLSSLLHTVIAFFPEEVVTARQNGVPLPEGPATLLFLDIMGFTRIAHRLAQRGPEGAEHLTFLINHSLAHILRAVRRWGGTVYRLAGDGVFALFRGDQASRRALQAGQEAMRTPPDLDPILHRFGLTPPLHLHGAIHQAVVGWCDLGSLHVTPTEAWSRTLELAHQARAGEIRHTLQRSDLRPPLPPPTVREPEVSLHLLPELFSYLPPWLQERLMVHPTLDTLEGEHRWMTILFLRFRIRPTASRACEALRRIHTDVERIAHRHEAWIARMDHDRTGYRILIPVGYPVASEYDEMKAVHMAWEIQNTLRNIPEVIPDSVRMGVHGGPVFVGPVGTPWRREITLMGPAINLTARLVRHVPPGSVWISNALLRRTGCSLRVRPAGRVMLPGTRRGIRVWRLEDPHGPPYPHLRAPFVGRTREVREILQHLSRGQSVIVMGDAGVGKSRLVREVSHRMENRGTLVAWGRASPHLSFPFALWRPVLSELLQRVGQEEGLSPPKVLLHLARGNPRLQEALPLVGEVAGLSLPPTPLTEALRGSRRGELRNWAVAMILQRIARRHPLLVVIEDLQWADQASLDLLTHLTQHLQEDVVFLGTLRPEGQERIRSHWNGVLYPLRPLTLPEVRQLMERSLSGAIQPDFAAWMYRKTRGNPLFVLEVLHALREEGNVVCLQGVWCLTGSFQTTPLPSHLERLVLHRVDRLPYPAQRLLRAASVLGETFSLDLLKRTGIPASPETLNLLVRKGYLKPEGTAYRFHHPLIPEILYRSLAFSFRRDIHAKIAETLWRKRSLPALAASAYHYLQAQRWREAAILAERAARLAFRIPALHDALRFLTWALQAARQMEDPLRMGRILYQRAHAYALQGDHEQAHQELEEAFRTTPSPREQARIRIRQAFLLATTQVRENFERAARRLQEARSLIPLEQHPDLWAWWLRTMALVEKGQDRLQEALQRVEEAVCVARQAGNLVEWGRSLVAQSVMLVGMGDYRSARAVLEEALTVGDRLKDYELAGVIRLNLGAIHVNTGDVPRALDRLRQAQELFEKLGDRRRLAVISYNLALLLAEIGQWREALDHVNRTLQLRDVLPGVEPRLMGIRGMILWMRGNLREASRDLLQTLKDMDGVEDMGDVDAAWIFLAQVAWTSGSVTRARNILESVLRSNLSRSHPDPDSLILAGCFLVDLLTREGKENPHLLRDTARILEQWAPRVEGFRSTLARWGRARALARLHGETHLPSSPGDGGPPSIHHPFLLRLQGETLQDLGKTSEAISRVARSVVEAFHMGHRVERVRGLETLATLIETRNPHRSRQYRRWARRLRLGFSAPLPLPEDAGVEALGQEGEASLR